MFYRLGESCSHVAALLFKLEAVVRLAVTAQTPTDLPCVWNDFFVANITPAAIKDIKFYRDDVVQRCNEKGRKMRGTANMQEVPTQVQEDFITQLSDNSDAPVALSLFNATSSIFKPILPCLPKQPQLPTKLTSLKNLYSASSTFTQDEIKNIISVTTENVDYLDISTVKQSNSVVWFEQRAGRITASIAGKLLRTKLDKPAPSLMKQILNDQPQVLNVPAVLYGNDKEKQVIASLKQHINTVHTNAHVTKTGMRMQVDTPWLSATADALIHCDCHGKCVVEVKSPYSLRDSKVEDATEDPTHYFYGEELNRQHEYFAQVQVQMHVYGAEWCCFLVLVNETILHTMISRDDAYLQDILSKLHTFWLRNVWPALLCNQTEEPTNECNKLYCYCREEKDDTMVGCDGVDCPYEWVHLSCIRPSRKTVPKGTWYCKECKKNK